MTYCLRIPTYISLKFISNYFIIKGPKGIEKLYCPYKIETLELPILKVVCTSNNLTQFKTWIMIFQQLLRGTLLGYKYHLHLIGLGYRASLLHHNTVLELKVGQSHLIQKLIPKGLTIECPKYNRLIIQGSNYQKITEFMKILQNCRKPTAYKKKGIINPAQEFIVKQGKKS